MIEPSKLKTRWFNKLDLDDIMLMFNSESDDKLSRREITRFVSQKGTRVIVAEYKEEVVGCLVYIQRSNHVAVPVVSVKNEFRGNGIGTLLFSLIMAHVDEHPRLKGIETVIPTENSPDFSRSADNFVSKFQFNPHKTTMSLGVEIMVWRLPRKTIKKILTNSGVRK